MAGASDHVDVLRRNELRRMLPGYLFLLPLLVQIFLMNPCYEKSLKVKVLRAALMPISVYLALSRVSIRLFYPLEEFFHWNFVFVSFATFHSVCLAIQYGLFQGSIFSSKIQLIDAGNYRGEDRDNEDPKVSNQAEVAGTPPARASAPSFLEKIKFTIWLIFSPRGLETSWAPSIDVVPRGTRMSLGLFSLHTLCKGLTCHIMMTVLWAIAVECAQHPQGAHGVLADYIPPLKFLKNYPQYDYIMPAPFGGAAWLAIETLGCILNLLEAILYQFGPYVLPKGLAPGKFDSTLYPPLFNQLWKRESLISFWSKGWHAIFRRSIIFCGWKPLEYIFSIFGKDAAKMAGMMGAMIFSGVFHEYIVTAASQIDPGFATVKMFALCGLGMVAEVQFKRRTGKMVQGIAGRLWMSLVIGAYGREMVNSWMERGLGRSDIPPPRLWTWPRFVIPFSGLLPERWISQLAGFV